MDRRGVALVSTALRCYPARWRARHGDEAADLAALLISDGTRPGSVALSYLAGAAREWLSRRLITATCVLLAAAGSLGVLGGLLDPAVPARAASTSHVQGHAHCRPGQPGPAAGPIPATSREQAAIRRARHDRSC
jgi:hypothetical protein